MKKGRFWEMAVLGLVSALVLASCATAGGGRMFPPVRTVSSGNAFGVGIGIGGSLWSVGNNSHGQLGNGSTIPRRSPVRIGRDYNWANLSVGPGGTHVVAIRTDGSLWAWGNNQSSRLGDGTIIAQRTRPLRIGTSYDWATVSTDFDNAFAIKTDGTLWAWGDNSEGWLGDGTRTNRHTPTQIGMATNWRSVSRSAAVKTNYSVWGWGPLFGNAPILIGTEMN